MSTAVLPEIATDYKVANAKTGRLGPQGDHHRRA